MDVLIGRHGKGTVHSAATGQVGPQREWGMEQKRRTPQYTTLLEDVPVVSRPGACKRAPMPSSAVFVSLPSRLVESAIALSVVLAALNNIVPMFNRRRWLVAFGFGLIHGFGFASVLAELGLPQETLVLSLVGFNLGVEAGQLAIVIAFLPVIFWLRNTVFYRRGMLVGGSLLIMLLALVWLAERVFDLKLISA